MIKINDTFYFNNPLAETDGLIVRPHTKTPTYVSPTGDRLTPVYGERINSDGERVLEVIGETNTYEKIQASLDSTKIEDIIRRYESGDVTILERSKGQYIDATKLPNDLMTAQNNLIALREQFDSLSLSVKEQFGMSFDKFLLQLENDTNVNVDELAPDVIGKDEVKLDEKD